jgi:hypothetical protein
MTSEDQVSQPAVDAEIKATYDLCVAAFTKTWRDLNPTASTPEGLAAEIERFAQGAFSWMFTRFPITQHAPPFTLWLAIFTAILEANTHPKDLTNKAIDLLRDKYRKD